MPTTFPLALEAARLLDLWRGEQDLPVLHLTAGESRADNLARFLREAAPATRAEAIPPWDCLPYDWASPSSLAMGRRMGVLRMLADPLMSPMIVIATPAAVLQRLPPLGAARSFVVRVGEPLDVEALRTFCLDAGYNLDDRVDEPGEVAIRGEVVDLFDAASEWPYRIEALDKVAAIRRYDPATQRSVEELPALVIDAASEIPGSLARDEPGAEHRLADAYPALATIFDHMPKARLSWTAEAEGSRRQALTGIREAYRERERQDGAASRMPPPERLYLSAEEWEQLAAEREVTILADIEAVPLPTFAAERRPRATLRAFLAEQECAGRRVVLSGLRGAGLQKAMRRLRDAADRVPEPVADWNAVRAASPGAVLTIEAGLEEGVVDLRAKIALLTPKDLLGSRISVRLERGAPDTAWMADASDLHVGDLVVHTDHGVARLGGLEQVEMEGLNGEAVRLEYAEGEQLLVPTAEAGSIWRYGSDEGEVTLDSLGGSGWDRRRAKVAEGLAETARALVAAAAEREAREAPKLVPDSAIYERLAARFPFEETPDQARAIADALADLASGRPMNRLVIGDVGFGKTEVAIRAAAAAVFSGRQVAVLAPTTVLARQHFRHFQRRFEEFGVEVAHLSRLVTGKEATLVKQGLKDGRIGIVVGTQALLGTGVEFADLGLSVIDEEQRLGLGDKAKVRTRLGGAHVLTLTATPIPRTLQSALLGLQDLSVIATPPARRRPIRTLVSERDPAALKQALLRERRRGGQSFVVVPRVEDIPPVARELQSLLPRFALRVAHGQLPAKEIDEVMVGFAEGDGDVLLATSIIESGLDVPRANTMVVLRPDLLGLAQLHQLRGRVGRGSTQAYCYLMTEPEAELPPAAVKRLGTLQALDRLGAGMAISAQDLDLRGGGELFGERQSGHVRLIGLALYQDLLAAAVRAAKGEPAGARDVEFRIEAAGGLPSDYIPEAEVRLNLYHRLARTRDAGDVARMEEEIIDRFGPPPAEVRTLLQAARIRALAGGLGILRISAGPEAVALDFEDPAEARDRNAEAEEAGMEWLGGRLVWRRASSTAEERLAILIEMLEEIT